MPNSSLANVSSVGILIFAGISLAFFIFALIIWWRIFAKTGYSGALSLLLLVPIANLIVILVLAFSEWPVQKELNMLRQQVASIPPQFSSGQQYPQYPPQGPQYPQGPSSPQYPQYR